MSSTGTAASSPMSAMSEVPDLPAVATNTSLTGSHTSSARWWSPRLAYIPTREAAAGLEMEELQKALEDLT